MIEARRGDQRITEQRLLVPPVDIDHGIVDHDTLAESMSVDEVVPDEESVDHQIGFILEPEFAQHLELLAGMRHGVAGIDDFHPPRAVAGGQQILEHLRVVRLTASGPTERIVDDEDAKGLFWLFQRVITIVETEAVRAVGVSADAKAEIRIVAVEADPDDRVQDDHRDFQQEQRPDHDERGEEQALAPRQPARRRVLSPVVLARLLAHPTA